VQAGPDGTSAVERFLGQLDELRRARGLSLDRLSRRTGIPASTLHHWLTKARRLPSWDQVSTIVSACHADEESWLRAWQQAGRVGLPRARALAADRVDRHRPCSLPSDVPHFVGRTGQLDAAVETLRGGATGRVTPVYVIAGMGGIGKTAFAVHLAHRVVERYPDGQVWLNLRGTQPDPAEPGELLARVLDRIGVPASDLPQGVDARAELLRDRLSGRRLLIVADDAATESQVRPLLPGSASSAVVVTSRGRLSGLTGAGLIELGGLEPDEARTLLAAVVGPGRVAAEEDAAASVIRLCGYLPLAIRIVAGLLVGRPRWRIAHLVDLLDDERNRLSVLETGDLGVAASIGLSYEALPEPVRHALRMLGALDAADFADWIGAAVLEVPRDTARRLLERLVDAYLLEIAETDRAGQVRYRLHDLVRLYARHQAVTGDPVPSARDVVARASRAWLTLAERAASRIPVYDFSHEPTTTERWPADDRPDPVATVDPMRWLDAEREAIVATVRQAASAGLVGVAADLAGAMTSYCSLRCEFASWYAMAQAVGTAARDAADHHLVVVTTLSQANLFAEQGELRRAAARARSARQLARRHSLHRLEAFALLTNGVIERAHGDLTAARASYGRAIEAFDPAADALARAYALSELGAVHAALAGTDEAERCYRQARPVFRERGDLRGEAKVALRLAAVAQARGELGTAERGFGEALALARRVGDVRAAAEIEYRLGQVLLAGDNAAAAADLLGRVAERCRQAGDARGLAFASEALGQAYDRQGDPARARESFEVALAYYRRAGLVERRDKLMESLHRLSPTPATG
jgi:tetratricopeptide (TPR) repeat protein/transcriptional regulator with XRE-family HTH domain